MKKSHTTRDPHPPRPLVARLATAAREGRLDRREFMALASTLGVSAAAAHALIGLDRPLASAQTPVEGGSLRIAMRVLDIRDPRTYDWPEMANVGRQFCETLVRWEPDFTFSGLLLEDWDVSEDAQTYRLALRPDALWSNGDPFTADDVVFNLERWCDTTAEGNSMANSMGSLIDPDTGQLAEGAVERIDDHTIELHLPRPDISLIAAFSDYPALIVHRSFDPAVGLSDAPIGTGAFELADIAIGDRAVVRRRESGWWGGRALLDEVVFIDHGTDPAAMIAALEAGDVHVNDETPADLLSQLDSLDLVRAEKETAQTIVARMNVTTTPYADQRVRRGIQMCVNNAVTMQVGIEGNGLVGENHHVGPMHPEYAELPVQGVDAEAGLAMLADAGVADTELELISIDADWERTTMDVIGAQLRQSGLNIKRTVIPGATFWNNWTKYPFSATSWGGRPLGVQVLALAYRSGAAWNETGFSDPAFDEALDAALGIFDPDERREKMAVIEGTLQESGIIIQPFWRKLFLHHVPELQGYARHPSREMHLERVWLDG